LASQQIYIYYKMFIVLCFNKILVKNETMLKHAEVNNIKKH